MESKPKDNLNPKVYKPVTSSAPSTSSCTSGVDVFNQLLARKKANLSYSILKEIFPTNNVNETQSSEDPSCQLNMDWDYSNGLSQKEGIDSHEIFGNVIKECHDQSYVCQI
jgi:hypothetical protein